MACPRSKRGHAWSPLAGLRTVGWDYSLRGCGLCGASGRVDSQGRVQTLWEPGGDLTSSDEREKVRLLIGELRALEHQYQHTDLHPDEYLRRRRDIVNNLSAVLA